LFPSQQHSETIVAFRGGIFIISVKDLKRFYMLFDMLSDSIYAQSKGTLFALHEQD